MMKGNINLIVMPQNGKYKVLCQYQNEEVAWGPFKDLSEVRKRIEKALKNLEKEGKEIKE